MTDNIKQFTGDAKAAEEILPPETVPMAHYQCMAKVTDKRSGFSLHMPDGCQGHRTHIEATECAIASEKLRAELARNLLRDGASEVVFYIMEQVTTVRTVENLETFK